MKNLHAIVAATFFAGCSHHEMHGPVRYDAWSNKETIIYDKDRNGTPEHSTYISYSMWPGTHVFRMNVGDAYDFNQDGKPDIMILTAYGRDTADDPWLLVGVEVLKEDDLSKQAE